MIRTLIVDDEPLARRGIRARLARAGGFEVVAECTSGREAVVAIGEHAPDLVFLDVQMPGLDGFGVIASVGVDRMPAVIFVTAYDAHALKAFEANALDYLLKPIDDDRFADAIARARRRLAERRELELGRRLAALIGEMGRVPGPPAAGTPGGSGRPPAAPTYVERFPVPERDRVVVVDVNDVDWVGADGDYVRIHTSRRSHLLRETMAAMEGRLDPARFVRIHRSTIVNVSRIRELRPHGNREYTVVLRDGTRLKLSRGYRDRVKEILGGVE